MATWNYLNTYLNSIPAAQKQKLLDKLYGDINSGSLTSVGEYESRLSSGMAALQASPGTPSFKALKTEKNGLTSSANYNDMESKAISDLKILYGEAVLLEQLVSDHGKITDSNLDSIISAVSRMEQRVDILEILASNTDGYISSAFNSFSEDNTNRLERYQIQNTDPFIVNGPGYLSEEYDAVVENNALHLPIDRTVTYRLDSASIENQIPEGITTLSSGNVVGEQASYALGKLIDNNDSTFWAETVDVSGAVPVIPAECDLIVNLLGVQQLSRIVIDPFSRQPFKITSISYKKNKNTTADWSVIQEEEVVLNGKTLIEFPTVYAEQIKLHIQQDNFSQLRYMTNSSNDTITKLFDITTGQDLSSDIETDEVYYAMTSNMKRKLGIDKSLLTESNTVDIYEYLYGIKTLDIGQLQYKTNGIYVSEGYSVERLGAVGLEVNDETSDMTMAEYDLIISLADASGNSEIVTKPILPSDEEVSTEVLDCELSGNHWVGTTRFGVETLESLVVKMNNTTLEENTHYIPVQNPKDKKVTVQILGSVLGWPTVRTSNFTVSYTPVIESYVVETDRYDTAIINLRVFLRSIDPNKLLTPSVRSYSLKFKKYSS